MPARHALSIPDSPSCGKKGSENRKKTVRALKKKN